MENSLFRYEGGGHTAFFKGIACIDAAIASYLIDRQLPPAGSSCPAETVSFGRPRACARVQAQRRCRWTQGCGLDRRSGFLQSSRADRREAAASAAASTDWPGPLAASSSSLIGRVSGLEVLRTCCYSRSGSAPPRHRGHLMLSFIQRGVVSGCLEARAGVPHA